MFSLLAVVPGIFCPVYVYGFDFQAFLSNVLAITFDSCCPCVDTCYSLSFSNIFFAFTIRHSLPCDRSKKRISAVHVLHPLSPVFGSLKKRCLYGYYCIEF
jgi:hypothetical protein